MKVISLLILVVTITQAQKSYFIKNMASTLYTPNTQKTCFVSVEETITFAFTGSYSGFGRPVKYASGISAVTVQSLSPTYSIESTQIQRSKDDNTLFIAVKFTPTPTLGTAEVTFKLSFIVDGIYTQTNKNDQLLWQYKFGALIREVNTEIRLNKYANVSDINAIPVQNVIVKNTSYVKYQALNIDAVTAFTETITIPNNSTPRCFTPITTTTTTWQPGPTTTRPNNNNNNNNHLAWIVPVAIIGGVFGIILLAIIITWISKRGGYTYVESTPIYYSSYGTSYVHNTSIGDYGGHHHDHGGGDYGSGISGDSGFASGDHGGGDNGGIGGDSGYAD
jgi:hypothetical protein